MTPRNPAHIGPDGRGFFGTVTVGRRGQVALPAQARRQLGLEPGDQLVVLTDPNEGIALIPLELLLSKQDNPVAKLVRSMLPGVMPPEGENEGDGAGNSDRTENAGDAGNPLESKVSGDEETPNAGGPAGKVADGGGDSR